MTETEVSGEKVKWHPTMGPMAVRQGPSSYMSVWIPPIRPIAFREQLGIGRPLL